MRKPQSTSIKSISQLKSFEIIDPNVSKKYIPIFTSQLIEYFKPEFVFKDGLRFRKGSSAHYINLKTESGDTLRLYNSYDRSLALRISFVSNGITIPLGIKKLVHRGNKASTFTEEFIASKQEILEAVKTAKDIETFMKDTIINKDMAKTITEAVFHLPKMYEMAEGIENKGSVSSVSNPIDVLIEKVTVAEYFKKSIKNYLLGEYMYTNKAGKLIKGPKNNSAIAHLPIENRVIKALKKINPELFL